MAIHIGADHAGFKLKEEVKRWLMENGYKVKDHGAFRLNKNDDYPDFMHPVGLAVSKRPTVDKGIVFGMTGQGEAMVCNRYRGVRATVFYNSSFCGQFFAGKLWEIIKLSRQHNNANVLALGAGFMSKSMAIKAIKLWLETDFDLKTKRHARRIKGVDKILK